MRIQVKDPASAGDLAEFLRRRVGAIVELSEPDELEVSLLGSYGDDALRDELTSAVRSWSLARQQPTSLVVLE
jgi:hypothetical protein